MIIKQFIAGPIEANNYLVADEESKEAVLIDCTEDSEEILQTVEELGVNVKYILLTHGHFDHVMGVNKMKAKLGAKALIHQKDLIQLAANRSILAIFGMGNHKLQETDGFVNDGDELFIGKTKIKVIHTPGHTEGCVCYLIEDKLFSGDTIFFEYVGRTDLPGGNFKELLHSVKEILFKLNENTVIYPGHGVQTTIKHEKQFNEIL